MQHSWVYEQQKLLLVWFVEKYGVADGADGYFLVEGGIQGQLGVGVLGEEGVGMLGVELEGEVVGGVEDAGGVVFVAVDSPEVLLVGLVGDFVVEVGDHLHPAGLVQVCFHPLGLAGPAVVEVEQQFALPDVLPAPDDSLGVLAVLQRHDVHLLPE